MRKNKVINGILLFTLCLALLLTGCASKELSLSSFGDVTESHNMRIVERDFTDSRVSRWSTARSDDSTGLIQFIECNSEADASSLFSDQVDTISKMYETENETGSLTDNKYTLTASGAFYEIVKCKQYVMVATCQASDKSSMLEIFSELPEVSD